MTKPVKKKKSSVRDIWIPATWRYNGAGYERNKKKYNRKQKHKKPIDCE